jgi:hypothetical protein
MHYGNVDLALPQNYVAAADRREQCLKSVDRLGKERTFPGDR